jgi:hypothetical protein
VGLSDNNRRARFYRLTGAGRKQLQAEVTEFEKVTRANVKADKISLEIVGVVRDVQDHDFHSEPVRASTFPTFSRSTGLD